MITNEMGLIEHILSYTSHLALGTMGVHSIDEFQDKSYYLAEGEFDPAWTVDDLNQNGTQIAFVLLRQIQQVTDALWNIRDNSVYVRDGFLFVYDKTFEDGMSFKASLGSVYTKASTSVEYTFFTKDEVLKAAEDIQVLDIEEVKKGKKNYAIADQFQYFKGADIGRKFYAWIYIFIWPVPMWQSR